MEDPGGSSQDLARLRYEHGERLKELTALHDIARLLRDTSLPVAALVARVAARLPPAMQFIDDTTARVAYGDIHSATPGFANTPWVLRRAFATADGTNGMIEIAYNSAHPDEQEGPFLSEERALIDSIADILRAELDRRSVDLAVRDRDAKLVLAAATADLAVWEWSVEDNIVTWSPELVRMLGRDSTGMGLGESEMIYAEDRQRVVQTVRDAVANPDRLFELEFRGVRVDRSIIWINARGRVLLGADGRPKRVLGILADVTRRKALEEGLMQLQKMEAMGRVAAGVAHDFNNVLGVIMLNTSELLEVLPPDHPCHAIASEISEVLGRGVGLTQQLLAFSRKSEVMPVALDPNTVIRRAEPMLRRLVGTRAQLLLELSSTPEVIADPTQLDQIVMNLVVNARDAIQDGGTVTVATRVTDIDAEIASANAKAAPGTHVVISVADTGHGMTPETKARLFEPFFTTKPVGKGTGLGLSVVFGVVQQSNGFVTVDSEPGQGARFDVHLPARGGRG
jgi:PAS domain S-box-containing protein